MRVDDLPEGLRLLLDAVSLLAQRCLDGNDDVNQLAQPFFIPHCTFGQEGPLEGSEPNVHKHADARRFSTGEMA